MQPAVSIKLFQSVSIIIHNQSKLLRWTPSQYHMSFLSPFLPQPCPPLSRLISVSRVPSSLQLSGSFFWVALSAPHTHSDPEHALQTGG